MNLKFNYKTIKPGQIEEFAEFIDWNRIPESLLLNKEVFQFASISKILEERTQKYINLKLNKNKLDPKIYNKINKSLDDGILSYYSYRIFDSVFKKKIFKIINLLRDKKLLNKENSNYFLTEVLQKTYSHKESYNGVSTIVKLLIEQGADVNVLNSYALEYFVNIDDLYMVKYLIEKGIDIHANNHLVIKRSAFKGKFEVLKILIEAGADVHALDNYALCAASYNGNVEMVKLLIDAGADIHARKNQALRTACERGHIEIIKLLIDAGVDIHANNNEAARLSKELGNKDIYKLLIEAGVEEQEVEDSMSDEYIFNMLASNPMFGLMKRLNHEKKG